VGTGPFVLTNWTRGAAGQIVLKPNKYYRGKKPSLNQIIYKGVTNATTQRLQVSRGTVDMALNVDIDGAKALQKDKNVKVLTGNTLDLIYMGMTTSADVSKPLSDKRVRQAVRYAIDYNGIIRGLFSNIGTQPNSMIPVGLLGNDTATNNKLKPKRNVAKAKALLKAAGYPNGFSIKLSYDGGVTFDGISYDLLAPKIAHDLADVGISAQLDPQQDSVLLPAYRAQKIAMILYNWGVDYPDSNDFAGPFSPGGGPAKRMWYTWDANMTKLVTQADSVSNPAKRASIYQQIQRIWLDEGPWVGVVQPRNIVVLHKGVAGYVYSPEYKNDFRTVHKS
jgi:peptide/nickel transport system substrate-binding protein